MRISDWSSDVCSSDLRQIGEPGAHGPRIRGPRLPLARRIDVPRAGAGYPVCVRNRGPDQRYRLNFLKIDNRRIYVAIWDGVARSEERRVGKECVVRVDLGGRRIIKKKKTEDTNKYCNKYQHRTNKHKTKKN